jgi:DNA polymerase-1
MLVGDSSDNIKGVKGIGPVKAKKIIDSETAYDNLSISVLNAYKEAGQEADYQINYSLLKLLTA